MKNTNTAQLVGLSEILSQEVQYIFLADSSTANSTQNNPNSNKESAWKSPRCRALELYGKCLYFLRFPGAFCL